MHDIIAAVECKLLPQCPDDAFVVFIALLSPVCKAFETLCLSHQFEELRECRRSIDIGSSPGGCIFLALLLWRRKVERAESKRKLLLQHDLLRILYSHLRFKLS